MRTKANRVPQSAGVHRERSGLQPPLSTKLTKSRRKSEAEESGPGRYAVKMTTRTTRHCRRCETRETKRVGSAAIRAEHDIGDVPSQQPHDSGREPGSWRWVRDVAVERFAAT